ncbi:mechanosensitive ion channel family protein [Parasporobacterium paucivorans]|uniref:Small conductance mechanosensitive channel n=1 Tax=Parasporobacterium paucivorans DSM 15970 TaxID=1122934 RepID=A0A1M6C3H3_9FIRM|nr:mechanosensitive ion channel domain-containing protein [Parasporobacterium paucivorans]SHI55502.1 small conductance mechanosensitive channel [Parasporobacterium paucivorans DSM 15970]
MNVIINQIESYLPKLLDFGINVLVAVIIFIIGTQVIKLIVKMTRKIFERSKMEVTVGKFLISLIKAVLYVVLIIAVCGQVGIQTASFIAVIGSAGLAIGLALQGSLSNFAGGVLILILKPFKVGDYIRRDGGEEGSVSTIDLFYTHLVTPDNRMVVVPNGLLANSSITNTTAFNQRRLDIVIGISYTSDIAKAKEIIGNLMETVDEGIDMPSEVFVKELEPSRVVIEFRKWVSTQNYWNVKPYLTEKVKEVLEGNGIELSSETVEVHIKKD